MKYHHKTQKAINEQARRLLRLYRNSRQYDAPRTARWRSYFAMSIGASGNVFSIIQSRKSGYDRQFWRS